jgi:dTDP-4-amino-4,6-dideoxygalactose transaminase
MPNIPLIRPVFDASEFESLRRCLESGHVTQGPFVAEFETRFASIHNTRHALAVTSCTTAMHAALLALGITSGDEVIVPAFTWVSTANVVEHVGARPIFADIGFDDFNIDPAGIEALITPRTKALIVVQLFGLIADMDSILPIARRHGIAVLEDAACATGSMYRGLYAGGFGDVGCFSFHPRKVITTGEGGMITTNDDTIAHRIRVLRNHGITPVAQNPWTMPHIGTCGHNFRLSDIQAAIGLAQLDKMDDILNERKRIAYRYTELFGQLPDLAIPTEPAYARHTWQSYVVRLTEGGMSRRNSIIQKLHNNNIQTRPGTMAVHRLEFYSSKYNIESQDYPIAAECENTTITLPLYHNMCDEEIFYVYNNFKNALCSS